MIHDPFSMVVAIVAITTAAGVFNTWVKGQRGVNRQVDSKLQKQDDTIAELRRRVEHLEALAADPTALAAMRVQQAALNSGPTVPARIGP